MRVKVQGRVTVRVWTNFVRVPRTVVINHLVLELGVGQLALSDRRL